MKQILFLLIFSIFLTGCQRTSSEAWEDVKTAGRYVKKSVQALFGFDVDESRQIVSYDDFNGPDHSDFIPLQDADLQKSAYIQDQMVEQPVKLPKAPAKKKGKFDHFVDASKRYGDIFRTLHFSTDNHVITEKKDLISIDKIALFLKKHPKAHLLIEGHCDERASADYNIALGMRRAQHVRVLLTKKGVNPQQIYTVSYGKEKPLSLGGSNQDRQKNRRAHFKLFIEDVR